MQIMVIVLGSLNFGMQENIEAFPTGTHPLVPMKWIAVFRCSSISKSCISVFPAPWKFYPSDNQISNNFPTCLLNILSFLSVYFKYWCVDTRQCKICIVIPIINKRIRSQAWSKWKQTHPIKIMLVQPFNSWGQKEKLVMGFECTSK